MKKSTSEVQTFSCSSKFFEKYREDLAAFTTHQRSLKELLELHAFKNNEYNYELLNYILCHEYASMKDLMQELFEISPENFTTCFDFNEILKYSKTLSEDVGAILSIVSSNSECLVRMFQNNIFMKYVLDNFSLFTQSFYNKFEELLSRDTDLIQCMKSSSIFDFCHTMFKDNSELSELADVNRQVYEFIHRYSKNEQESILKLIQVSNDNQLVFKELFKNSKVLEELDLKSDAAEKSLKKFSRETTSSTYKLQNRSFQTSYSSYAA